MNIIKLLFRMVILVVIGLLIYEVPYIYQEIKHTITPYKSHEVIDSLDRDKEMFDTGSNRIIRPINEQKSLVIPRLGINEEIFFTQDEGSGVFIPSQSRKPGSSGEAVIKTFHEDKEFMNRENSQYGLLYKLEKEDIILVYYQGNKYEYMVKKIITVPSEIYSLGVEEVFPSSLRIDAHWPPGFFFQKKLIYATLN